MQSEKFFNDFANFISERISNVENNELFEVLSDSQKADLFKSEKQCYIRGFRDGMLLNGV